MGKTALQQETEAHYAAWLNERRQGVDAGRGERLEALFAQMDRLAHLRFEYAAGRRTADEVRQALRRYLDSVHEILHE